MYLHVLGGFHTVRLNLIKFDNIASIGEVDVDEDQPLYPNKFLFLGSVTCAMRSWN